MTTAYRVPAKERRAIGVALHELCKGFHDAIPISDMMAILAKAGIVFAEPEFILCGREGRTSFDLLHDGTPLENMLILTWYKMDSGRYEVVSYLS